MIYTILHNRQLDMEFKSVYTKGRNNKGYRFLMEYLKDDDYHKKGDQTILFFEPHSFIGYQQQLVDCKHGKWIIPGSHFKFKSYNYYYLDTDYTKLEAELVNYKNTAKIFYTGSFGIFSPNYKPRYKFNDIVY